MCLAIRSCARAKSAKKLAKQSEGGDQKIKPWPKDEETFVKILSEKFAHCVVLGMGCKGRVGRFSGGGEVGGWASNRKRAVWGAGKNLWDRPDAQLLYVFDDMRI